jgi:hypothetical protein
MKCEGCDKLGFSYSELLPDGLCPTCRWLRGRDKDE